MPRSHIAPAFACWIALVASGCAADLSDALGDDSGGEMPGGDDIETTDDGTASRTLVDATDGMRWIWLDLETLAQVEVDDPKDSDAWDLGFLRYNIAINGGASGNGGMEAIVLDDRALDDVTAAPDGPWITDLVDSDDQGDDPDYALANWYEYDFMTHVLTPFPTVYVVRTVEGNLFALQVVGYYDEAGTSGWMQLRHKPLE